MTQRIFDVENKQDMQDLWSILPDEACRVRLEQLECFNKPRTVVDYDDGVWIMNKLIAINWHDKTEITRSIQEATEQDVGKLCVFSDGIENHYEILKDISINKVDEINAELQEQNYILKGWCDTFRKLNLGKKNKKLKELLKECRKEFDDHDHGVDCDAGEFSGIIAKIDQVLGE